MPPPRSLSQARVIFLAVVWIGAALIIGWLAGRKPPVDRARLYKLGYGDDAPLPVKPGKRREADEAVIRLGRGRDERPEKPIESARFVRL